jgi:hypothetical protein
VFEIAVEKDEVEGRDELEEKASVTSGFRQQAGEAKLS